MEYFTGVKTSLYTSTNATIQMVYWAILYSYDLTAEELALTPYAILNKDKSILQPRTNQEICFSTSNYETG